MFRDGPQPSRFIKHTKCKILEHNSGPGNSSILCYITRSFCSTVRNRGFPTLPGSSLRHMSSYLTVTVKQAVQTQPTERYSAKRALPLAKIRTSSLHPSTCHKKRFNSPFASASFFCFPNYGLFLKFVPQSHCSMSKTQTKIIVHTKNHQKIE